VNDFATQHLSGFCVLATIFALLKLAS